MLTLIERLYGLPNLGVGNVFLRWGFTPLGSFEVKCFTFFFVGWVGHNLGLIWSLDNCLGGTCSHQSSFRGWCVARRKVLTIDYLI